MLSLMERATTLGQRDALYYTANIHFHGKHGHEVNPRRALRFFHESAKKGVADAMVSLVRLLFISHNLTLGMGSNRMCGRWKADSLL